MFHSDHFALMHLYIVFNIFLVRCAWNIWSLYAVHRNKVQLVSLYIEAWSLVSMVTLSKPWPHDYFIYIPSDKLFTNTLHLFSIFSGRYTYIFSLSAWCSSCFVQKELRPTNQTFNRKVCRWISLHWKRNSKCHHRRQWCVYFILLVYVNNFN